MPRRQARIPWCCIVFAVSAPDALPAPGEACRCPWRGEPRQWSGVTPWMRVQVPKGMGRTRSTFVVQQSVTTTDTNATAFWDNVTGRVRFLSRRLLGPFLCGHTSYPSCW
jgi:hypothetical protein